mmetsp:Transcript_5542/g.13355  ORF Transcript_5542/g.13355 Transcript_5542/m.13355 type:complete len:605 (-) Transcript_5542:2105-3919(-)
MDEENNDNGLQPADDGSNLSAGESEPQLTAGDDEGHFVRKSGEVIKRILEDATYHDVTLKASDGLTVTASRNILAASSPVFHATLFGPFKESGQPEIDVGYDSVVIRQLIKYIHGVPIDILDGEPDSGGKYDQEFEYIVKLADAAKFYQLQDLQYLIDDRLMNAMSKDLGLAVKFLAWSGSSQDESKWIVRLALNRIRYRPEYLLRDEVQDDVQQLPYSVMEAIVKDTSMYSDEFTIFRIVLLWSMALPTTKRTAQGQDKVKEMARKLVELLDLTRISPLDIASTVEPSGLVSSERLFDVFRTQAMASAYGDDRFKYQRRRDISFWRQSNSDLTDLTITGNNLITEFDTVDCEPMKVGFVHSFAVMIEKMPIEAEFAIGLTSSVSTWTQRKHIVHQDYLHLLFSDGSGCSDQVFDPLEVGDRITFILDLAGGNQLSIAVNDGEPRIVRTDIVPNEKEETSSPAFFPIVASTTMPKGTNRRVPSPHRLCIVSGAAVHPANGEYTSVGPLNGAQSYGKISPYNGQLSNFRIFRCDVSDGTRHWYLSIVPENVEPGTSDDVDFYTVPARDDSRFPPTSGWTSTGMGLDPSPLIETRQDYRLAVRYLG